MYVIDVNCSLSEVKTLSPLFDKAAVAIGNFDGVHRGHARILQGAVERARRRGGTPVVLTFDPHPRAVISDGAPPFLATREQRRRILRSLDIKGTVSLSFDRIVAGLDPVRFVEDVVIGGMGATDVIVGEDFRFGRKATGDAELLTDIGRQLGFSVAVIEPVTWDGEVVSSSLIRQTLLTGDAAKAAQLLGRPFALAGTVVRGEGRGAALGFPTANVDVPAGMLVPGHGVYVADAYVVRNGKGASERERWPAVAIISDKPTFQFGTTVVEVHLLDFQRSLLGETIEIALLDKLRDIVAFATIDELTKQMKDDVAAVRRRVRMRVAP